MYANTGIFSGPIPPVGSLRRRDGKTQQGRNSKGVQYSRCLKRVLFASRAAECDEMSRPSFARLKFVVGLGATAVGLGSRDAFVRVHYPKLNWKSGGPSEVSLWNRALGMSFAWETRLAKVSISPSGSSTGPRCAITKVNSRKLPKSNERFGISNKVKFDAEPTASANLRSVSIFRYLGNFQTSVGILK